MPTYEYRCPSCGKCESNMLKMNYEIPVICIECHQAGKPCEMKRGPGGGIAVHFTGSGFYETDYKGK